MSRESSALAWAELQTSDQLTAARRIVYEALCELGPLTAGELTAHLKDETETRPSYHKRLSELERQGCVEAGTLRPCKVTGKECIEWKSIAGVTPLPLKARPGRTKAEKEVLAAARRYAERSTTVNKIGLLTASRSLKKQGQDNE